MLVGLIAEIQAGFDTADTIIDTIQPQRLIGEVGVKHRKTRIDRRNVSLCRRKPILQISISSRVIAT
jgi:hypothetical protein